MEASGAYLDHAATSPLLPEALDAMLPFLGEMFANPSASYRAARSARRAVDDARDAVAAFAGCAPDEVVFTSGGTEADNLAVRGTYDARPGPIAVTAVEHDAVLRPAVALGATVVGVDGDGALDLDALEAAIGPDTTLVSIIAAQNETGVLTALDAVAERVRTRAPHALLHVDAVQAAPFLPLGRITAGCDLATISAHKIGGPKGVGALIVRRHVRERVVPLIRGGGQERELRAGTENVAAIVGFGSAASVPAPPASQIADLRDLLAVGIVEQIRDARITGAGVPRAPQTLHLHIPGVASEELLVLLDEAGVAASAGSACASGALELSHVLRAMGWPEAEARSVLRLSLGRTTTRDEIERTIPIVASAVRQLRGL
jgi:cysteine desulfurase